MKNCAFITETFLAKEIPDNLWEKFTELINTIQKESAPDDPPETVKKNKRVVYQFS